MLSCSVPIPFWHTYRVAYTAIGTSLFGDETRADHLTCQLLGILCAVAEVSTAFTAQSWPQTYVLTTCTPP
jgi:hypothetical protein